MAHEGVVAKMDVLQQFMETHPIVPFIREGDFAVRKPWVHPERRLLDYLIVYVQEGHCRFSVDHVSYEFHSGEFCLIQPGSLNTLEGLTDTITPFVHLDIFYHPERVQSFPTKPGQIDISPYHHIMQPRLDHLCATLIPVRLHPDDPAEFANTLLNMVECWRHGAPTMQLRAQSYATNLIIMLLESHVPSAKPVRTQGNLLHWVRSYLSIHMSENLTVQDMADRANLSVSRFNEVFKHEFGVTPRQFLIDMRISHAKELLLTTTLSVDNIASYCGFSDIYHFSKIFKRRVGISPTSFRRAGERKG